MFGPATWNPLPVHIRQSQCLVTLKKERDGGGERERGEEEEKGQAINELCIIVLLLVLNLLFYHI